MKKTTIYRAYLPDFCGYGSIGYGDTPEIALKGCKKGYFELKRSYQISSNDPNFGTFSRTWDYFGGYIEICESGKNTCEGNLDLVANKIINQKRTNNE